MPRVIGLAVFDCDGTLIDSLHAITTAMGQAFTKFDLPAPESRVVRRIVGLDLGEAIKFPVKNSIPVALRNVSP